MPWTHQEQLRKAREQRGLTQRDAADLVGVRERTWGSWERGTHDPEQHQLARIVEALGVPPDLIGYQAPEGWELVPSEWIRQHAEQVVEALKEINQKLDDQRRHGS